jgi:hypothetical protein
MSTSQGRPYVWEPIRAWDPSRDTCGLSCHRPDRGVFEVLANERRIGESNTAVQVSAAHANMVPGPGRAAVFNDHFKGPSGSRVDPQVFTEPPCGAGREQSRAGSGRAYDLLAGVLHGPRLGPSWPRCGPGAPARCVITLLALRELGRRAQFVDAQLGRLDELNEDLAAWQNWPLDRICPV